MSSKAVAWLFIFYEPTTIGKGTVADSLCERYPNQFYLPISTTTHQPCPDEVEDKSYFFVPREESQGLIDSGGMLGWAEVYQQNLYGTPTKPVDETLARGLSVLLEVDLDGFRQARTVRLEAHSIFLLPPSWEGLKQRLIERDTESTEEQHRHPEAARAELAAQNGFNELIVNDNLADAVSALVESVGLA